VPVSTGWLPGECMEARGKQELWLRQRPEVLAALREQAIIQSAESSNRIERVTVAGDRGRGPGGKQSARLRRRRTDPASKPTRYRRTHKWL